MGLKDTLTGGNNTADLVWKNPEWATPQNVESLIEGRIRALNIEIKTSENNNEGLNMRSDLRRLKEDRNIVNAIRLYGPLAPIRQSDRIRAARHATVIINGPAWDKEDKFLPEKAEENQKIERFIGAALGHKLSIKELKKQKAESQKKFANPTIE
ncbi:hypothetical protein KBC75_02045 [Candidatus Shapirobacteria bacterium]|nr:hypothetical protein [Candidatus Shapirobacteria bacterium]